MFARCYYLATGLPTLGGPGERPPMEPAAFMAYVAESRVEEQVRTVLLADDLRLRDAFLHGEVRDAAAAVLTPEQVRGEASLPGELEPPEQRASEVRRLGQDVLWEAYARWVNRTARRCNSVFLRRWIRWEVGLRNGLAEARARALDLDPEPYLVAPELGSDEAAVGELIRDWESAPDVASSLEALIRGRWSWLEWHRPWFSFEDDEFPAYAVGLSLMHRWWRIAPGTKRAA